MLYKHETGFINRKLFNTFPLMGKLIKTKDGNYSIEYKTYVPKFYTCITYCLYLGNVRCFYAYLRSAYNAACIHMVCYRSCRSRGIYTFYR